MAADAAAEIVSRAARKDADKLSIDAALRDPALFNGLRRILHEERAGGDAPEEEAAVLASKVAELKKLLAGGGDGGTLAADVRALSAAAAAQDGTVARLAGAAVAQSVASAAADGGGDAAALVAALEPLAAAARARDWRPRLERLRAEIARDGATPSLPKSSVGTRKRVVIVGGGFCGAMVAYKLDKIPELHVTLLDTKEYVENTPAVLSLMCLLLARSSRKCSISPISITRTYVKNGDVVIGSLAAVRTDHILYGAKTGVAAKALPYDYLVISTGTSYQSDIKTEGTSIEHRRRSFQIEHQRIRGCARRGGGGRRDWWARRSLWTSQPISRRRRSNGFRGVTDCCRAVSWLSTRQRWRSSNARLRRATSSFP